jgi:hypothetical protein
VNSFGGDEGGGSEGVGEVEDVNSPEMERSVVLSTSLISYGGPPTGGNDEGSQRLVWVLDLCYKKDPGKGMPQSQRERQPNVGIFELLAAWS